MTVTLLISRVARPFLTTILLAAISGCSAAPLGVVRSGSDVQQVQFDNPGPHQINVYSVAPDADPNDPHPRRVHLRIYLDKDPDSTKKHHFKVTHKPEEDVDTN